MDSPKTVLDSWSSISEKTVFVLDRSSHFTQVSSGHSIDGDFLKRKDLVKCPLYYTSQPAIKPFDRSLWTCTVEAVVGYSRLVWDLFRPEQRCISILSIEPTEIPIDKTAEQKFHERICTWKDEDQNLDQLMKSLAKLKFTHKIDPNYQLKQTTDISTLLDSESPSNTIMNTLDQALNELGHLTAAQIERKQLKKAGPSSLSSGFNNGRIILISSFKSEEAIKNLVDDFWKILVRKNENFKEASRQSMESSTNTTMSPINYCDLVVVNTYPINDTGMCSQIGNSNSFRPYLHCKTYSVKSGCMIAGLLNNLCLQHHNLRSTTITGIPMKEEQNASSSSQYDVEIVHCSSIHEDILSSGSPLLEGVVEVIDRNGFPCDTFKLSWCTPRSTAVEMNHCVATSRITAVDVNSRPSTCLTNFLLNGRSVMLEIFKSKSNRMTTHVLASHNGELYIHSLATLQQKQALGDTPAISDHLGGKVGDYRVNDFVNFMKQHTLSRSHIIDDPLTKTCNMIKRQTIYWPLAIGHTILLNVPNLLGKLLQIIPKDALNQSDIDDCKKSIDGLLRFQREGHGLPSVTIIDIIKTAKGSGTKLEQLYKLLWNELEYFLRVHSTTAEHEIVLEYLLDVLADKTKPETERGNKRPASKTTALESAQKKVKLTEQLIPEMNDQSALVQQTAVFYKTGLSLWQTWTSLYRQFSRDTKLTFFGRSQPVQPYPLYQKEPAHQ